MIMNLGQTLLMFLKEAWNVVGCLGIHELLDLVVEQMISFQFVSINIISFLEPHLPIV